MTKRFVLAALLILVSGESVHSQGAASVCRRLKLNPVPGWTPVMIWSTDGKEILIVETTEKRRVLRYDRDGRFIGIVPPPTKIPYNFEPFQVHATPNGFLIQNSAYYWMWFGRDFGFQRFIQREDGGPRLALVSEVLLGNELFGLGTFYKSGQSWGAGILRVRLEPLELVDVIEEVSFETKGGTLHTTILTTTASAGGDPFMLRFDEPSYIQNIRTRKRLRSFPRGFDRLPQLPRNEGPDSTVPRARIIESSTFPVALYSRGAYLYVLTRKAEPEGKTLWQLHGINPRTDALLGTATLPVSAANLRLAPGPEHWAVMERGPLIATGKQDFKGLLLIPAAVLDAAIKKGGVIPACQ